MSCFAVELLVDCCRKTQGYEILVTLHTNVRTSSAKAVHQAKVFRKRHGPTQHNCFRPNWIAGAILRRFFAARFHQTELFPLWAFKWVLIRARTTRDPQKMQVWPTNNECPEWWREVYAKNALPLKTDNKATVNCRTNIHFVILAPTYTSHGLPAFAILPLVPFALSGIAPRLGTAAGASVSPFFPYVCSCTMLIEAHWVTQEVSRASSAIRSSSNHKCLNVPDPIASLTGASCRPISPPAASNRRAAVYAAEVCPHSAWRGGKWGNGKGSDNVIDEHDGNWWKIWKL